MKYLLTLILLLLPSMAHANTTITALPTIPSPGVVLGTSVMAIDQNSTGTLTTYQATVNSLNNFVYSSFIPVCSVSTAMANICTQYFGFADPRWFGAFCDSIGNNNFHDDAPGIMASWANTSQAPTRIPNPACKIASTMTANRNGIVINGSPHAPAYNSAGGGRSATYLFTSNDLGDNLALDYSGYDSFAVVDLDWSANFGEGEGTGAIGSFYTGGIRNGVDFIDLLNVSIGNFGIDIGDTANETVGSACSPNLLPSGVLMQMSFMNLRLANSCAGIIGNITDMMGAVMYANSMLGPCVGSERTSSASGTISDFRCEAVGFTASNGVQIGHGAGIDYNSALGLNLVNFQTDSIAGASVHLGTSGANFTWIGGTIYGNNVDGTTPAAFRANVVMEAGASHFTWSGVHKFGGAGNTTWGITSLGNVDYVSIGEMDSVGLGTTAFANYTGTVPHLQQHVLGTNYLDAGQNYGLNIGLVQPLSTLDIGGNLALGIGYAGVTAAPTNGLIVQGVVGIGTTLPLNSTVLDARGLVTFNGEIANGTPFVVASGCGTTGAVSGGTTAGSFTAGATSCVPVITLPNAPHGWICKANDLTNPGDVFTQTGSSVTSCTMSATVTSSDNILLEARGF